MRITTHKQFSMLATLMMAMVASAIDTSIYEPPIVASDLKHQLPFFTVNSYYPVADTFVVRQSPDAFMGYNSQIFLHAETHYGFIEFDVQQMVDAVKLYGPKLEAVLRLYVKWSEHEHNPVQLWHVKLRRPKWSDASLKWQNSREVDYEGLLSTVFTTDAEFMEFDISTFLRDHVEHCKLDQESCRYLTFRLQTENVGDTGAWWTKFISKDAIEAEQSKRPSIRIHKNPWPASFKCVTDLDVNSNSPHESTATFPALRAKDTTNLVFLQFDLSSFGDHIHRLEPSLFVKLRLYVMRAQRVGAEIQAHHISFRDYSPLEADITFEQASQAIEVTEIPSQEAYPGDYIEFDITSLVKALAADNEVRSRVYLRQFQIRLRNPSHSLVTFASNEYHDIDKRPIIAFSKGSFWHDDQNKPRWGWLRKFLYFVLAPIPLIGGILAFALCCGYGPQITRFVRHKLQSRRADSFGKGV